MSEENVEIVRRVYDALNHSDWDAVFRDAHPGFEVTLRRGLSAGTHRSREKVQAILLDQREAFDAWLMEPSELYESGEQVVAVVKSRVRPKGSSAEIELRTGHIWTIRDGKIVSMVGFPNADDALEAAGLSE